MTTIFSSIDILSPLVSDKFFSVAKNKSKFGALCSLIFFVILIIGIQRSFSDLLARDAPSIQSSEQMAEDPMKLVISPDRFPLSFYVSTPSALGTKPFKSDMIYTLEVYYLVNFDYQFPNGTVTRRRNLTKLDLEECTKEYAGEHASKFENRDFTGSHCISKNQSVTGFDVNNLQIQGRYSLNTYQALAVAVKPCIPKRDPITNVTDNSTCASQDLIKTYLTGAWFTVGYFNHLPTLQNFEQPLDVYIDDHTTIISPNTYKHLFIEVGYVEATTDSGLIFENKHKDTSFKVTRIDEYLDPNLSSDQSMITCLIQSAQKETYYSRSYKKFQSTLADIGGLANAVLGIILILATPYLKFKARENLMNNVFTVNDEPKFEKAKPEKKKKKNKKQSSSVSQSSKSENTKIFEDQRTLKSLYVTREETHLRPLQSPTGEETFLKNQSDKSLSPQVKRNKDDDRILSMSDLKAFSETSKYEKQIGPLLGLRKIISETSKLMNEDPTVPCMSPTEPAKGTQAEENQSKRNDKSDIENQLEEYDVVKAKKTGKFLGDLVEDIHLDDPSQHIQENDINIEIADPKDNQTEAKPNIEVREQENNLEEKEKEEEEEEENSKQMLSLKQKEVHLKLWEYAVSLVYRPKSKSSKIATVQAGVKNIDQRLELSNILKKLSEVDKLILLMLDSDQLELFNSIPKPKLLQRSSPSILRKNSFETSFYRKTTMEDYQPDEKNLMTAYRNLKSKETKTEIDKRLIDIFQKKVQ